MKTVRPPASFFWAWLLGSLPLLGWWTYGLFDLDEGFYGAITAEMNRRGEWITPFYNGNPWFEKPVLLYWISKPFLALFGDMVGPRLGSVVVSVALIGFVGWFTRRRSGDVAAAIAMVVQGTLLLSAILGRMMMTDTLLSASLAVCFLTLYESLVGDKRWRLVSAFFLGLSVLAKGPVGCLLFVPILAATYFMTPKLREAYRGYWGLGTLIFLVTISTWYVPAYLVNRDVFVQKFLIEQNLNRFTGGDTAHTLGGIVGWVFYVPILLVGSIPWTISMFRSARGASQDPLKQYLWIWSVTIFVFFTVSKAKLPHYILPAFPALAILVGGELAERWKGIRWPSLVAASLGVWAFVQGGFTLYYQGGMIGTYRLEGPHAELHDIIRGLSERELPLTMYQMTRRSKELGTGGLKIQETSHPSASLYWPSKVVETESVDEIPPNSWIITRVGRSFGAFGTQRRVEQVRSGRYFILLRSRPNP
ncbi:MAG: ArnT family glycosyltransferase [Fimbriimonas sp.]